MINEISQSVVAGVSPTTTGNSDSVNRLQVRSTKDASNEASIAKLKQSEADLVSKQSSETEAEAKEIKEAVDDLNEFAQSVHRQLEFSVDDESGKTVVRVIDVDTGETSIKSLDGKLGDIINTFNAINGDITSLDIISSNRGHTFIDPTG